MEGDSMSSCELYNILAKIIEKEFKDILEEINQDESSLEMTAKDYDVKKSYLTSHLTVLSHLHSLLVKQHFILIDEFSKKCPSGSSFPHVFQMLPPSSSGTESPMPSLSGCQMFKILAEVIEDEFKEIIQKIETDGNSSGMTASIYKEQKSYLRVRLTELYRWLDKHHFRLIEKLSRDYPSLIKNQHPVIGSVQVIKMLIPGSAGEESSMSTNMLLSSLVKNLVDELYSDKKLQKLKEIEKSHLELQQQVADLKLMMISESDRRMKTIEEELETSIKSLPTTDDTSFQQNQTLVHEHQLSRSLLGTTEKELMTRQEYNHKLKIAMESCVVEHDDKIQKLIAKNDGYVSEISKLKQTFESEKRMLSQAVENLNGELKSREKLIQELQTNMNALQVEHQKVLMSSEYAEKHNEKIIQERTADQFEGASS